MYALVKVTSTLDPETAAEIAAKINHEDKGDALLHVEGQPLSGDLVSASLHPHGADILDQYELPLLYEKCKHCHLFVEPNSAYPMPGYDIAEFVHLHRGDEVDEALDESHEPTPSGLKATLDTWRVFGPWQMRQRFVDKEV